jgi:hypothetical protein
MPLNIHLVVNVKRPLCLCDLRNWSDSTNTGEFLIIKCIDNSFMFTSLLVGHKDGWRDVQMDIAKLVPL